MKGYQLLQCNSNEVVHSWDVYFNEDQFLSKDNGTWPPISTTWTEDPHFLSDFVRLSSEDDTEGGGDIGSDDSGSNNGNTDVVEPSTTIHTVIPTPGIPHSPRLAQPAPTLTQGEHDRNLP